MKAVRGLAAAWLVLSLASPVLASSTLEGRPEAQSASAIPFKKEARSDGASPERIGAAWIVALAALAGGFWLLKRRRGSVTPRTGSRMGPVRLVQTVRLAPQATLHVVDFGDRRILLAQTPQGVARVASTDAHASSREGT